MKTAGIVAAAVIMGLAVVACGSAESNEMHAATVRAAPSPLVATSTCKTEGHGTLRVHGVSCTAGERVVRGFTAEGGTQGAVLTVEDFVCEEHGRRLSCAGGTAGIVYTAAHP